MCIICQVISLVKQYFVGDNGIEPLTSFLSGTRSTTEPITLNLQTEVYHNWNLSTKWNILRTT